MKMSTLILSMLFLFWTGGLLPAQKLPKDPGGLYSSWSDFVNHKLTYPTDCLSSKDKLKVNDFFGASTGYVVRNGEKFTFNKNEIYGYRTCDRKNYRFYYNEAYQILDTLGFYLYYHYKSVEMAKGKGLVKTDLFYFSRTGSGDLQLLTLDNLKNAFPDNASFQYALDASFHSDRDLAAFDGNQKVYKVKYVYQQSLKL